MTIFYYKSNGDIYSACTGSQDINIYFGIHSNDLVQILGSIELPNDDYVTRNTRLFKVDITKSPVILALKPVTSINTYPVATS